MNYIHPPNKQLYFEHVWTLVRQIPRGRVATYGQIMKAIPPPDGISPEVYRVSASRWVGAAMAACPDDVPWHRVVNSQGKISHLGEAVKQKQRLAQEDVLFANGKLDLRQYQWRSPEQEEEPEQGRLF